MGDDRFFPSVKDLAKFYFERGGAYFDLYRAGGRKRSHYFHTAVSDYQTASELAPENVSYHNRFAYACHFHRMLEEAGREYDEVLRLDPPLPLCTKKFDLILRYAPRIYVTAKEFFPLQDVVVVVHPDKPLIEYSLFWANDINFPEDSEFTDHEKVWVEYESESRKVVRVYTYFHGTILSTKEAVEDARVNEQRPRVSVQWGGHGSLPVGWEDIPAEKISVKYAHVEKPIQIKDMRGRYEENKESIRIPNHPLARTWPKKFAGTWEEFVDFSKYVDSAELIKSKKMAIKSRWPNAVIMRYLLDYNFRVKQDWPMSAP